MKRHSQKRSIYAILICFGLLFPPESRGFAFAVPAWPAIAALAAKVKVVTDGIVAVGTVIAGAVVVSSGAAYVANGAHSLYKNTSDAVASVIQEKVVEEVQQKGKEAIAKVVVGALVGDSSKQTQQTPAASKNSEVPASVKTEPKVNADKSHTTKNLQDTADKFLSGKQKVGDATLSTGQSQSNAKNDTAPKAKDFSRDAGVRSDEMHKSAGDLSRTMDKTKPGHETSRNSLKKRDVAWLIKQEMRERDFLSRLVREYQKTGNEELHAQIIARCEIFKATFGKDFEIPKARVIGFVSAKSVDQDVLTVKAPDITPSPTTPAPELPKPDIRPVQPGPVVPAPAAPTNPAKIDRQEPLRGWYKEAVIATVGLAVAYKGASELLKQGQSDEQQNKLSSEPNQQSDPSGDPKKPEDDEKKKLIKRQVEGTVGVIEKLKEDTDPNSAERALEAIRSETRDRLDKLAGRGDEFTQHTPQQPMARPVYRVDKNTGEKVRIVRPLDDLKAEEWVAQKYEDVRKCMDDIKKVSKNTKWDEGKIKQIKDHVFYNKHKLDSGVRRFDPDAEMASAWDRLANGDFTQNDIRWLEHEYCESVIEVSEGVDYRTAHKLTEEAGKIWKAPRFD
ncbi:MAG TPA: hypothetical protein VFF04_00810 [Candidatus Babeliales bacterium]|nr:hypothetical protein [Candidatus Babeliales bacterium]